MIDRSADDRQRNGDARLREYAPYLFNPTSMEVFGLQGLDGIPGRIRRKVRKMLGEKEPLAWRAWKALNAGETDIAQSLLLSCVEKAEGDISDERFFSVFWALGTIALKNGDPGMAISHFVRAIETYPTMTREEHYIQAVSLILDNGGTENDAAAIVQQGIERLRISTANNTSSAGGAGEKLLSLHARLERNHNNESRPSFPRTYLS